MLARARIPVAVLITCVAFGCDAEIDHAAQRQHELIDHEYDRKQQLVDRLFANWHSIIEHDYERQLDLIDHVFDAQLELFTAVLEAEPPPGFGPETCSFTSTPSGAEVFQNNLFDEWEYVGKTPLVVDRPLARAREIEVRLAGHEPARGYMLSEAVHGPCEDHFTLAPR